MRFLWSKKHSFYDKLAKNRGAIYAELERQIVELIYVEIGNYLYDKTKGELTLHFNRSYSGFDVYIYDKAYEGIRFDMEEYDENKYLNTYDTGYEMLVLLLHLHDNDMLWFLFNKDEKFKKMKKQIKKYIKAR